MKYESTSDKPNSSNKGDLIFLEPGRDLFCPKTGRRISPGQCARDNLDFICIPADVDS